MLRALFIARMASTSIILPLLLVFVFASGAFAAPRSSILSNASPISGSISTPAHIWTQVNTPSFSASCEKGVSLVGAITPDFSSYILALVKDGKEKGFETALTSTPGPTTAKKIMKESKKSLLSLGLINPNGFTLVGTGKKFLREFANAYSGKTPDINRAFEIVSASSYFPPNTSALITANNVLRVQGKSVAIATGIYLVGATGGQAPGNQFLALMCRDAAAVYYPPVGIVYTEGESNMAQVRSDFEQSGLLNTKKLLNAVVLADRKAR